MTTKVSPLVWLIAGPPVFAFVLAVGIASSLWEAFVVWRIYEWHMLPLGLPAIPFTAFMAADMIVTLTTTHLIPDRDGKVSRLFLRPVAPTIMLALAWWLR